MAHSVRRAAAVTIASALLIGVFAPLVVGSATAPDPTPAALLAAPDATSNPFAANLSRGAASDRSVLFGRPSAGGLTGGFDDLGLGLQSPPSVVMKPTIIGGATPQIVARPAPTSGSVSGKASWYCCTRGWRGQAVVALPAALGGHYDAAPGASLYVIICADRCARIPVVDTCGCHYGTATQKVADLSPEAWAAITDRDRFVSGVVTVTITFGTS